MFEPEELMARIVDLEAQLKVSEMAPPAAEQLIACLEGEIAKRDAKYQREVYGLNNEGDPIGGDPAGGYANDNLRLRAELAAIKAQGVRFCNKCGYHGPMETHNRPGDGVVCDYMSRAYAAPVSEAKAQGVVQWPEADEIMQMAFEEGQPADDASGYCFELEEFDLFIERLMSEVARLNAAPVQQVSVPDGWNDGYRAAMNSAASGARQLYVQHCHHHGANGLLDRCKELEQSFIRDADAMLAAAPAAPAADAGLVEALGYQVLFDAIAAATRVYANGSINISVQAFREALAAHRAAPAPGGE